MSRIYKAKCIVSGTEGKLPAQFFGREDFVKEELVRLADKIIYDGYGRSEDVKIVTEDDGSAKAVYSTRCPFWHGMKLNGRLTLKFALTADDLKALDKVYLNEDNLIEIELADCVA